jgi:hypothetical protein
MFRRLGSIVLAAAIILSTAACGQDSNSNGSNADPDEESYQYYMDNGQERYDNSFFDDAYFFFDLALSYKPNDKEAERWRDRAASMKDSASNKNKAAEAQSSDTPSASPSAEASDYPAVDEQAILAAFGEKMNANLLDTDSEFRIQQWTPYGDTVPSGYFAKSGPHSVDVHVGGGEVDFISVTELNDAAVTSEFVGIAMAVIAAAAPSLNPKYVFDEIIGRWEAAEKVNNVYAAQFTVEGWTVALSMIDYREMKVGPDMKDFSYIFAFGRGTENMEEVSGKGSSAGDGNGGAAASGAENPIALRIDYPVSDVEGVAGRSDAASITELRIYNDVEFDATGIARLENIERLYFKDINVVSHIPELFKLKRLAEIAVGNADTDVFVEYFMRQEGAYGGRFVYDADE